MYHHVKQLMYTVHVDNPDPRFGNMLLEQFGGPNGELAAAMQYTVQAINCEDGGRKDLLMDIGTEEISHLEVIGNLARLHLKPTKKSRQAAEANPFISIVGGGGVGLTNSMGVNWTAGYLKISGQIEVDLRSNIAAEARAKITYERLLNFCDDPGSKDALMFLMTREIAHMKSFMIALDSLGKDPLEIGQMPPDRRFVNKYFNDSTGTGPEGETDTRGPWNTDGFDFEDSPVLTSLSESSGRRLRT
ncbi:MAG: manganese catalase family protein [Bryobacterales bacterium]|nr:manganese catalase family protein [Bryobacterales bacterium]MBV9396740.1 manganese catalase family protein [Bryobacterales bacterium]